MRCQLHSITFWHSLWLAASISPSHQVCKHPLCSTPNIDKLPDPTTSPCLSPPATTDLADPPVQSTTLSPRRSAATSSIFPKGCTATFPVRVEQNTRVSLIAYPVRKTNTEIEIYAPCPLYTPGARRMRSRLTHRENPWAFPPPRFDALRPKNRRRDGLATKLSSELSWE